MATTQSVVDVHTKKLKVSTTGAQKISSPHALKQEATLTASQPTQANKVPRRSSQPIINWLQRKLAGSGKAKRTENLPLLPSRSSRSGQVSNRQTGRISSSPHPVKQLKQTSKIDNASVVRRKTRSMSADDELPQAGDDDTSDQLSLNRDSIWSPTSYLEADDDASVRPLPPSSPPSPSPSRDSSSYLSDPRTFCSMTASTKPTTLISIDLNGGGMAHIAQVPPSQAQIQRITQGRGYLAGGGVFNVGSPTILSAVNPSTSSRPSSLRVNSNDLQPSNNLVSPVQAPLHTTPHPRNNPRPSSPPVDNASVLTLASSAFALSNRRGIINYTPSAIGDSVSHYGGSVLFPDGESVLGDEDRLYGRDIDASVRALRPRSSRRGSWESEASRWSARDQGAAGSFLGGERGRHISGSIRTGAFSEQDEISEDRTPATATREIDSEVESVIELEPQDDDILTASDTPTNVIAQNGSSDGLQLHRASTDTIGQEIP